MAGDFGVGEPSLMHGCNKCWALVLQRSSGQMFRGVDNCGNNARPGKLTCKRHDRFEAAAQKRSRRGDGMIWTMLKPWAVALGDLPEIFREDDPRPAAEQVDDRYAHGGGWRPQVGWNLSADLTPPVAAYPGDPPQHAIAMARLRDETLLLFPHAYVAIVQADGEFEMARMD